jgi:hypothetical protein
MKSIQIIALVSLLAFSHTTFAHHSDAGLDENTVLALEGKVTEFRFRQPHVIISVEAMQNGKPVVWDLQMGSVNQLIRQGWSADSLRVGEQVSVSLNPATSGKPYGKLKNILRADGSPVAIDPESPESKLAIATSLHGNWSGNRPGPASAPPPPVPIVNGEPCTSGFDCFFRANLVLTDAGRAAMEAFDPLSDENPEATCVGRPTPSALMSAKGYMLQIDMSEAKEKIYIRSEWFNEERTIWMDGRGHPPAPETVQTGYSIGHWEGKTLVIDTQNFDDHRSPYQIGVPSGSQKHVVEKYTLNDDGTSMRVEYMLEDPEFLAEPLVHSSNLYYRPDLNFVGIDCDIENTSRFLN